MARTYNGTLHEKNVNNMQDYYEVSKKNKYRKCMVTIDDKRKRENRMMTGKRKSRAVHGWVQIKQVVGPSIMLGGGSGGEIATTLGIVEYLDGTVEQVYPAYIRFVDTKDYTGNWEG